MTLNEFEKLVNEQLKDIKLVWSVNEGSEQYPKNMSATDWLEELSIRLELKIAEDSVSQ